MLTLVFYKFICDMGMLFKAASIKEEDIDKAIDMILYAGKVLLVGNGGSAAIALHMQNDLCKAVGIRALEFTSAPLLTALSNDNGYNTAYYGMVNLWADQDDVLIAISSSGESRNIIATCQAARSKGCKVITLSGFKENNQLSKMGDINFYIPSEHYGMVEQAHSAICHYITDKAQGVIG
jgi:D-sedoheptulose 7-phosphate isomerase